MTSTPGQVRRRRSPLTILGVLLLAVGLSCLGWIGWQYLGTNVVSERAFDQTARDLRSQWDDTPAAPEPSGSPSRQAAGADAAGSALALMRIPRFGRDWEVPVLAGTDLSTLGRGIGHYTGTAGPGQVGNFAVAGHRVTHGEPFARLLELRPGDEVVVETRSAVFTYVIDAAPSALTVDATAGWVLEPVPGKPEARPARALITLTTCQDLFRSADRSVGFGHLESTTNK